MSCDLTIDVAEAGALVDGTSRGDVASEWFAAHRPWRWMRSLRQWGLPRNLRPETVELRVAQAVAALEELGLTVEVTGREHVETEAERVARLDARDRELVEVHQHAAGRHDAAAQGAWEAARAIADMIPTGQPVLAGHHSQRRHERDLARIHRGMDRSVAESREAEDRRRRSASAAQRVARREAAAQPPAYSRENVAKGQEVLTPWGWMAVVRANAKTVTIPNMVYDDVDVLDPATKASWTCTLAWAKVRGVRDSTRS